MVGCYAATAVGFLAVQPRPALEAAGSSPSPPSLMLGFGAAMALMHVFGGRVAPAVLAGTLLAQLVKSALPMALALAVVKTAAAWAGVLVLRRSCPVAIATPLRCALGAIQAGFVGALIVTVTSFGAVLALGRPSPERFASDGVAAFFGIFLSGLIGALMILPFVLPLGVRREGVRAGPTAVALLGAGASTAATLFLPLGVPSLFLPFPFIVFAVARAGRHVAETMVVLVGMALLVGAIQGYGPLPMTSSTAEILHVQPVVALMVLSSVLIAGYASVAPLAVPGVVLVAAWALAALVAGYFDSVERERDVHAFDRVVQSAYDSLRARMAAYEDALLAGASLFTASDGVSRAEWRAFITSLGVLERYPGMNSIGVAVPIRRGEEAALEAAERAEVPSFRVHDVPEPGPPFPERFVMLFREGTSSTSALLGLDLASDPVRRAAALKARETGLPALSRQVALARGRPQRNGFLMFVPIPDGKAGWVYASFAVKDLFDKAFGAHPRPFLVAAYDRATAAGEPLYADASEQAAGALPRLSRTLTFEIAQQTLTMTFRPSTEFPSARSTAGAFAIAGA